MQKPDPAIEDAAELNGIMNKNSRFALISSTLLLTLLLLTTGGCSRVDIADAEQAMHDGNYAEAYCIWNRLAERGHPIAMYNIGWMYHNGFGLVIDDNKAAEWWRNAAESGLEDAEQALGMLYYYGGKGIDRNLQTSAEYLMPGAARGDEEAAMLLESFIGKLDPEMRERFQMLVDQQVEAAVEEVADTLGGKPLVVSANLANLRADATTKSAVVVTLKRGAIVGELDRIPDWVKVQYAPGKPPAWVHASLVKATE